MSKYEVVIKKIKPRRHSGFRYEVMVYWNRATDAGDIGWSHTLWGACYVAKRLVKKHELPEDKKTVVKEYSL